jgi:hypothetical protein
MGKLINLEILCVIRHSQSPLDPTGIRKLREVHNDVLFEKLQRNMRDMGAWNVILNLISGKLCKELNSIELFQGEL